MMQRHSTAEEVKDVSVELSRQVVVVVCVVDEVYTITVHKKRKIKEKRTI